MKYLTTEEYLNQVNELVRVQNRRTRAYFVADKELRNENKNKFTDILTKFEMINNYVSNVLYPTMLAIKKNERYIFQYFDDYNDTADGKSKYFKIIIKNKIRNTSNFIIVSYNFREFIIKAKPINSDDNEELIQTEYKIDGLTKGKIRKIVFEYLQEIIQLDTFPKKHKTKSEKIEADKIANLQSEISKMKRLALRNQEMLANAIGTSNKIK